MSSSRKRPHSDAAALDSTAAAAAEFSDSDEGDVNIADQTQPMQIHLQMIQPQPQQQHPIAIWPAASAASTVQLSSSASHYEKPNQPTAAADSTTTHSQPPLSLALAAAAAPALPNPDQNTNTNTNPNPPPAFLFPPFDSLDSVRRFLTYSRTTIAAHFVVLNSELPPLSSDTAQLLLLSVRGLELLALPDLPGDELRSILQQLFAVLGPVYQSNSNNANAAAATGLGINQLQNQNNKQTISPNQNQVHSSTNQLIPSTIAIAKIPINDKPAAESTVSSNTISLVEAAQIQTVVKESVSVNSNQTIPLPILSIPPIPIATVPAPAAASPPTRSARLSAERARLHLSLQSRVDVCIANMSNSPRPVMWLSANFLRALPNIALRNGTELLSQPDKFQLLIQWLGDATQRQSETDIVTILNVLFLLVTFLPCEFSRLTGADENLTMALMSNIVELRTKSPFPAVCQWATRFHQRLAELLEENQNSPNVTEAENGSRKMFKKTKFDEEKQEN